MNEREELLLLMLKQASTALAETHAELKEAKQVVADWDEATHAFKRKTIEQWEHQVEKLEKQKAKDEQELKEARAAFMQVVLQGNSISNVSASARYSSSDY
jgi:2-phospho-L-lactate guanylyltransferase (CobY/MobA/RfbA family)